MATEGEIKKALQSFLLMTLKGKKFMKTQKVCDLLQSFAHSGHAQDEVLLYVDGRYLHIKDVVLEYCHEMINGKMCQVHKVLIKSE